MKKKILMFALICGAVFLTAEIVLYGFMDRQYGQPYDTMPDYIVISESAGVLPNKCIVLTDASAISRFLNTYRWHDSHLYCCEGTPKYVLDLIKNDAPMSEGIYEIEDGRLHYNLLFSIKIKALVSRLKNGEDSAYMYAVSVPDTTDLKELKNRLAKDTGWFLYANIGSRPAPGIVSCALIADHLLDDSDWLGMAAYGLERLTK